MEKPTVFILNEHSMSTDVELLNIIDYCVIIAVNNWIFNK